MIIEYKNRRIRSIESGFVIERRINLDRWKFESHYGTLANTAQGLFSTIVNEETVDYVICTKSLTSARACTAELIDKIERIANEIQRMFK